MKDVLEKNPSLYLDSNTLDCAEGPKIFHVRPAVPALRAEEETPLPKSESTRRYLYGTDVFKLHSRPGAEKITCDACVCTRVPATVVCAPECMFACVCVLVCLCARA